MKHLVIALFLGLVACSKSSEPPPSPNAAKSYEVKGSVVSVEAEKKQIVIDHEAIPGFMEAMTMPFHVADAALLEGKNPGDKVEFTLVYQNGMMTITRLEKAR